MATPTSYQRVGATAADYDASAGPVFLRLDGVDDSLASATFAAGTIPGLTDCLIAVRRDTVPVTGSVGFYQADTSRFVGVTSSTGDTAASFFGCGTPTSWVDGTQLAGGTATSRATLNASLTAGAWHIYEMRGLDLSAWTSICAGFFTGGLQLNGALGEIQLFASGQDANRDLSRAQMAAYFGVTLP